MADNSKIVVITGASGGLGQAVVPAFVKSGAVTVAVDRHPSQAARGYEHLVADLTDERDVQRVVTDIIASKGRIDALVNLVGTFAPGALAETDVATWQRMLQLNLTAAFLLTRAVLPHMTARTSGRVVHIAANAALNPFPGAAAYIVAKSGLVALIKATALELTGTGVTINGVLPTTIDTPANRTGMPNADRRAWVSPDALARVLLFLVSDDAAPLNGALLPAISP